MDADAGGPALGQRVALEVSEQRGGVLGDGGQSGKHGEHGTPVTAGLDQRHLAWPKQVARDRAILVAGLRPIMKEHARADERILVSA